MLVILKMYGDVRRLESTCKYSAIAIVIAINAEQEAIY